MHSATFHSSELLPCRFDNCDPADRCMVTVQFPCSVRTGAARNVHRHSPPRSGASSVQIWSRSISSSTDRCSSVMESTSRNCCFHPITIPSTPVKAPLVDSDPLARLDERERLAPDTGLSAPSAGNRFPLPTTRLACCRRRAREALPASSGSAVWCAMSNRQHTYPGNSGSSASLERDSYLCRFLYKGSRVSYPFPANARATALSKRGFTAMANHCADRVSGLMSWHIATALSSTTTARVQFHHGMGTT